MTMKFYTEAKRYLKMVNEELNSLNKELDTLRIKAHEAETNEQLAPIMARVAEIGKQIDVDIRTIREIKTNTEGFLAPAIRT